MAKKILVVDDEPHVVKVVKDRLAARGYDIVVAYDGEEAFDKTINEKPDLVLLDIMMPKLDGFEVCRRIKANKSTNHIPVFILTAKTELKDEDIGLESGADGYIMKPFDPNLLEELVANVFVKKQASK